MPRSSFQNNPVLGKFTAVDAVDHLETLANDVKGIAIETCARVAEIHRVRNAENDFQNGYNQAVADISRKIRELNSRGAA